MHQRSIVPGLLVFALACGGSGNETATASATDTTSAGPTTTAPPTTSGESTAGSSAEGSITEGSITGGVTSTTSGPTTGPGTSDTGTADTGTADTGTATTAGTTTGTGTTGAVDFCEGEGGISLPGDLVGCTGDLGKKTFLFALCSCTDFKANNMLTTDSFDSEMMNMMPMDGGSVGVNGTYNAPSPVDIGGSLWVEGSIQTFNTHEVAQQLQCGGDVTAKPKSHVGEDAFVEGNISANNGTLTIDGDLHIPADKLNNGAVVLGQTFKEPVDVKTPCDCSEPYDIAAIVQGYKQANDNAEHGISAGDLTDLADAKTLMLPCGIFFFDEISSNQELKIVATGRTVIAIEGDINSPGPFTIEIGPGAELDLFLTGNATFNGITTIGDPTRPVATRLYVGGEMKFSNKFTLGANLYQPNAVFTVSNAAEIWGSLFVGGFLLSGKAIIHYDQAILDLDGCEEPGGGCDDCHDCANPTPKCDDQGTCVPCVVDSDCCPPLACDGGVCKAITPG